MKAGFVTIIGRPNVGKSTLMNSIIGENLSIVSKKPNTTRVSINGIKTTKDYQIIFFDTPGIHNAKDKINKMMVATSINYISVANVIYYLIDPFESICGQTKRILQILKDIQIPKLLLINKIDISSKEQVLKTAKTVYEAGRFTYVLPVSALKKINITELEKITVEFLPESEIFYDSDIITTNDNKLLIAEFVREQIYKLLNEEVPYEILVICKKLEERENLLSAAVEIVVNRDSQKGIVIGKNGKILKEIGVNARKKIEYFYGCKVYLDLWVKIINNWQINDEYLKIQGLI